METLMNLVTAVGGIITVGAAVKLAALGIQMGMDTEDKSAYTHEMKNVLIVLVISILVTGGGYAGGRVSELISDYFDVLV